MDKEAKIKRLAEIQDEITKLAREGVGIAEAEGVTFSLGSTPMASGYGIGGLEYIPKTAGEEDYWGDIVEGWKASSSYTC